MLKPAPPSLQYPPTNIVPACDESFGVRVEDPYRWLENDVRTDRAVREWVDAQNALTQGYLATLPGRVQFRKRLEALWNFEKFGCPVRKGERYFYERNTGLQNQSVLYVQHGCEAPPSQLIDPNGWSVDGTMALAQWMPARDGRRLAYAIQDGGSDWRTVRVLDVDSGENLVDELHWVKFSGLAWAKNGSGFYYSRFPAPNRGSEFQSRNLNQAVYFHRIGEEQLDDHVVYATPARPTLGHSATVTDDGRWLVVTTYEGTDDRYEIVVQDLVHRTPPRPLIAGLEHAWSLAGASGDSLLFVTNLDAPRYRVIALDPRAATPTPREIVPQSADTIVGASVVGDRLLVSLLVDARSVVRHYALDGSDRRGVSLPGIGTAEGFHGQAGNPETFFVYTSFATPPTVYRLEMSRDEATIFNQPQLRFDPSEYVVSQEFCASKDGTRIPMFIVTRAGARGPSPTVLYGYGGFNVSLTPTYSSARLAWLAAGGSYVVANLRGGGEYGKDWHDGGRLFCKQNVFDDCIAVAEHLISTGVTTRRQLALLGGSNGGLLVGAVVNQRPDLFAAASPQVGVMDMLRYNQFTAGRYWVDDYGDPAEEAHFRNLRAYSPYHNILPGRIYPAILVATADTDDRVVPGHSFKYVARLQATDVGPQPRLIRIETRAGHGAGKPTDKAIDEYADLWAFIGCHTGLAPAGECPGA